MAKVSQVKSLSEKGMTLIEGIVSKLNESTEVARSILSDNEKQIRLLSSENNELSSIIERNEKIVNTILDLQ